MWLLLEKKKKNLSKASEEQELEHTYIFTPKQGSTPSTENETIQMESSERRGESVDLYLML